MSEGTLPDNREVSCEIKYEHPMYGLRPIHFEDVELEKLSSTTNVDSLIGPIQYLVRAPDKSGLLHRPLSASLAIQLATQIQLPSMTSAFITRSELYGILDTVRNITFNWSVELEKSGIRKSSAGCDGSGW